MIELKDQKVEDEYHKQEPIDDLIRIQKALFLLRDLYCTLDECGNIWQNYSWSLSASWLFIPQELDTIISCIESGRDFICYKDWIDS